MLRPHSWIRKTEQRGEETTTLWRHCFIDYSFIKMFINIRFKGAGGKLNSFTSPSILHLVPLHTTEAWSCTSMWKNTHRSRTTCHSRLFHSQITRSHLYRSDITTLIRSPPALPSCFLFLSTVASHRLRLDSDLQSEPGQETHLDPKNTDHSVPVLLFYSI